MITRFLFIYSTCLFTVITTASAQKIKFGFRTGASFANFIEHNASGQETKHTGLYLGSGQPVETTSYNPVYETGLRKDIKIGMVYNLYIDYSINDRCAIEMGVGFTQKGIDLNYNSTSHYTNNNGAVTDKITVKRDFRLNYLTAPVLIKYKLGAKKKYYLAAGAYTAYLLNGKISDVDKRTITYGNIKQESVEVLTQGYAHHLDLGLTGGAGVELPINQKWSVAFDVRLNLGMVNVPADYTKYNFFSFSRTTKNINLETGLKFVRSL
jgi:hypothetical protein